MFKSIIIWVLIAFTVVMALQIYLKKQKPTLKIQTSDFIRQIENTNIISVAFTSGSIVVKGEINVNPKDPSIKPEWIEQFKLKSPKKMMFTTTIVDGADSQAELAKKLDALNINYETLPSNDFWKMIISSFLPIILIVLVIGFFINRQMKRGMGMAMTFGKSRAKKNKDKSEITFKDVAGCDEAKEEVTEIIDYLKDPKKFEKLGGKIPRGVMLMGQPGTGKTLLAKAVAGEADVPFFSISGSDFVEMFVGVGASRVRDLFEQGKHNAPCIIFVDEIDAVGRLRGAGLGGGHDEREQTLNALLVEMDGFNANDGVIIVAATNRPDVLDPALLRPGRFDRQIVIDMPDQKGREEILNIHVRKIKLHEKVDLSRIARGTPGFSGAELANLVNEAALMAARNDKENVEHEFFEEARDKVRFGRERKSRKMDEKDKRRTAWHEAGHALVTVMIPECEPIHKVTIIPRGIAYLGATMQLPEKDKYHYTKNEFKAQLATFMAGRIAEKLVFDDVSSGASSDIKYATEIARKMVCEWGMSDSMGPLAYGSREEHIFLGKEIDRHKDYSEETARNIDQEIRNIIDEAEAKATQILTEHRDKLDAIGEALMKYEVIDGDEVDIIMKGDEITREVEIEAPKDVLDTSDTEESKAADKDTGDIQSDDK
ncbi:MAG: cell division protein FtsH [Chlamydiae bacterium]|nr:MAG: cell division protein FtsH [Chlamydiota bacterium]